MNIDKKLESLKNIQPVDAPPFLYTRIKQEIDSSIGEKAPANWRLAFATIAILIFSLNISILLNTSSTKKNDGIDGVVSSMGLSNSNDLYNE
jgi:hypothetical protein